MSDEEAPTTTEEDKTPQVEFDKEAAQKGLEEWSDRYGATIAVFNPRTKDVDGNVVTLPAQFRVVAIRPQE